MSIAMPTSTAITSEMGKSTSKIHSGPTPLANSTSDTPYPTMVTALRTSHIVGHCPGRLRLRNAAWSMWATPVRLGLMGMPRIRLIVFATCVATTPIGCGEEQAKVDLSKAPGCFAEPNMMVIVGGSPSDDPVRECSRYWRNGGIARRKSAPPLTVCVGPNRTPWVVPGGTEVCRRLGVEKAG